MQVRTSPLADSRFRLVWTGQTLSFLGDALVGLALTLTVVKATGSAADLGLVLAAAVLPRLLLMPAGGVWADRLPRQRVMLTASLVSAAVQLTIGAMLFTTGVHIGYLAVLSGVYGAASAFLTPATTALVAGTVDTALLRQANALLEVSRQVTRVAGPTLATAIVLGAGAGWAFMFDGLTFVLAALTLAFVRAEFRPARRESFRAELAGGWSELRRHRWLWTSLLAHAVWNLCISAYPTLAPLLLIGAAHGELAWTVATQASAIGAVAGAVAALRVQAPRPLLAVNVALSTSALPLAAVALGAPLAVVAVSAAIMNAGLSYGNTVWCTALQVHVPERALSRVSAYDWLVSLGLSPVGLAVAGPVALAVGAGPTLLASALLLAGACLGVLAVPEVRRLTATAPARVAEVTAAPFEHALQMEG
jgi:MFS family permease